MSQMLAGALACQIIRCHSVIRVLVALPRLIGFMHSRCAMIDRGRQSGILGGICCNESVLGMTHIDFANQSEETRVNQADILLVYDKQCPFCDYYCRLVRIRESVGTLVLVDAREDTAIMQEITAAGLDIDQGMVLKMKDRVYYGSDAMHALSLLSTRSGIFNRINFWVFSSRWLSRVLYPIFRFLRNLFLKARGVSKINNLDLPGNDRF